MTVVAPRAALLLIAAFAVSACAGQAAPTSAQSEPPVVASESTSPAATSAQSLPPTGRNPGMDASEATWRAAEVRTGESWLGAAEPVARPAWARTDPFWSDDLLALEWYRIGTRDGNDILQHGLGGEFVEVTADGTPTWIPFPFPWQDVVALDWMPEIDADSAVYYDSLAVAATANLDGQVLDMHGAAVPEVGSWSTADVATIDSWTISRFTREAAPTWGDDPGWADYTTSLEDVAYGRRSPSGGWYDAPPIRPAWSDITWETGYGTVEGDLVDLFDSACGPVQTLTWNILLTDPDPAEWNTAGTVDGDPVYALDSSSGLAALMYDYYALNPNGLGLDADASGLSAAGYVTAPAVLAVPAGDGSGWWLLLNRSLSLRAWC